MNNYSRNYYIKNKDRILERNRVYRLANKEKFKLYQKKYVNKYPERVNESKLKWFKNNKEKHRLWPILNRDKSNAIKKKYKLNHPELKLREALRQRISYAVKTKNVKKIAKTLELIGCTIEELRVYLEKQFKNGMKWENRGYNGWHIDHIKPISLFDLTNPEQQKVAFHFTNLQPLWAKDNFSKKNKYDSKIETKSL